MNTELFNCDYYAESHDFKVMNSKQLEERLIELGYSVSISMSHYWYSPDDTFYISGTFVPVGGLALKGGNPEMLDFSVMFEYDGLIEPGYYPFNNDGTEKDVPEDIDQIIAAIAMEVAEAEAEQGYTKILDMNCPHDSYISFHRYSNNPEAAKEWHEDVELNHSRGE